MKVRSLIALVALVHAALFLAAASPEKATQGSNASPVPPTSTGPSRGFHRGG